MSEIAAQGEARSGAPELGTLARKLGAAYRSSVAYHKKALALPAPEAVARAEEPLSLEQTWRVLDCPPEEVSWSDLEDLARGSPERALCRWEELKREALNELRSGHRAGRALEGYNSDAWQRAQFLALREELAREWQPRGGVERQLIDTMAQAQTAVLFWLERLALRASVEPLREERDLEAQGGWSPPRVTEHQAVEQAGAMAERFQRIISRALRSLAELRRRPLAVVVQGAGQVNIGQQQVNVGG